MQRNVTYFEEIVMEKQVLRLKAENGSFPGFEKSKNSTWEGPFSFIQGADTQLGMIEEYIEHLPNPGWEKDLELTRQAIEEINNLSPRPRFFVVCGDLVHAMPETLRVAQEQDFIRVFKELHPDIPLVCVCGNHDIGNTPTVEAVQNYRKEFGDDYFSFYTGGVMFIVLNSQFFQDPSLVQSLAIDQEAWLDTLLDEAKSGNYKHVIVFQHIPYFLRTPDEEVQYFNLGLEIRQKLLEKLYIANVRAVFAGHWHGNAGGFYKELEVVVTSAIGCQLRGGKSGFRIVTVTEDAIKHKYYNLGEVPKSILLE